MSRAVLRACLLSTGQEFLSTDKSVSGSIKIMGKTAVGKILNFGNVEAMACADGLMIMAETADGPMAVCVAVPWSAIEKLTAMATEEVERKPLVVH